MTHGIHDETWIMDNLPRPGPIRDADALPVDYFARMNAPTLRRDRLADTVSAMRQIARGLGLMLAVAGGLYLAWTAERAVWKAVAMMEQMEGQQ